MNEDASHAAAGWLVFVGVVALFYELAFIVLRFVNVAIVNSYILVVIIIVSLSVPSGQSWMYHIFVVFPIS